MMASSPLHKIDTVLEFLATNRWATAGIKFDIIYKKLKEQYPSFDEHNDWGSELSSILNKLEKDGYVYIIERETDEYKISFEGRLFYEQKGYLQQAINSASKNMRLETLESFQRANAHRMTCLTIVIAVGTSIAAVYYAIEVLKFYHVIK